MNKIDQYIAEIIALGKKYDLAIVGTCVYEGIYGEISIVCTSKIDMYMEQNLYNFDTNDPSLMEYGQDGNAADC